jgi:hypothetical protein
VEPIQTQTSDWLRNMCAKLDRLGEHAAQAHALRMAGLPPLTCERCYGTGYRAGDPFGVRCSICHPPQVYAVGVPCEFQDATLENYRVEDGNRRALERPASFSREHGICI